MSLNYCNKYGMNLACKIISCKIENDKHHFNTEVDPPHLSATKLYNALHLLVNQFHATLRGLFKPPDLTLHQQLKRYLVVEQKTKLKLRYITNDKTCA